MDLASIKLVNFKCFKDSGIIPIHRMTIFIGENDSGKSSILKALKIFFMYKGFSPDCFHQINGSIEKMASIELCFNLDDTDFKILPKQFIVDGTLKVKQDYSLINDAIDVKPYVFSSVYADENLCNLNGLKAGQIEELCKQFNVLYTTKDDSKLRLTKYLEENDSLIPKISKWVQVKWGDLMPFLPIYENYDSSNYGNPLAYVDNTLKGIYRSHFYDDDGNGNLVPKGDLKDKENQIKTDLNDHIENELKKKINDKVDKIVSITGDFSVDFASGFSLKDLLVDFGDGVRSINNIGEGSKKRMLLALLEWDCELRSKTSKKSVIRGYDEPDANLHYEAQKKMFYALNKSSDPNNNVQVIICTHSVSMVDRAPASSINRIMQTDGCSSIDFLKGCDETDIKSFLDDLAGITGIKNSSIFFERCFLIVEGDTEWNALPLMHHKITQRHMAESGVVLINLKSNSCWKEFLKLLNKNKSDATILFLDRDIQDEGPKKITVERLNEIGFPSEFMDHNVVLVGTKEFEDEFTNDEICRCLNARWPKFDDSIWLPQKIEELRGEGKFSKKLYDLVHYNSRIPFGKPEFGKALAELLPAEELMLKVSLRRYIELMNSITS
ncbi:MAG: chromosome segregation protein [Methanomassiliicoccales archaeon PtaU1.Bin124]|nr:MAG: chromosome segregation protein [Methanomassiliicoccales archaeon PtaU1.Bin124]